MAAVAKNEAVELSKVLTLVNARRLPAADCDEFKALALREDSTPR
jgi:hypothetical protein